MIQYYVDVAVCPNSAVQIVRNSHLTETISKLLNYQKFLNFQVAEFFKIW